MIAVSRYNEGITRKLLAGAEAALAAGGFASAEIDVVWVPGAFELPLAVQRGLGTGRYRLAVALGVVIRGETPHFEYVSGEAARGLGETARRFGVPVGFGLLTCDTQAQAQARAGGDAGNKGAEAASAAVETARALDRLEGRAEG